MSAETKVDVLAVMDYVAHMLDPSDPLVMSRSRSTGKRLAEARAAVAELIEADREYDEANSDWDQVTSRDPDETDDETWRRVSDRFEAAVMRRIAALARIGGAK